MRRVSVEIKKIQEFGYKIKFFCIRKLNLCISTWMAFRKAEKYWKYKDFKRELKNNRGSKVLEYNIFCKKLISFQTKNHVEYFERL